MIVLDGSGVWELRASSESVAGVSAAAGDGGMSDGEEVIDSSSDVSEDSAVVTVSSSSGMTWGLVGRLMAVGEALAEGST